MNPRNASPVATANSGPDSAGGADPAFATGGNSVSGLGMVATGVSANDASSSAVPGQRAMLPSRNTWSVRAPRDSERTRRTEITAHATLVSRVFEQYDGRRDGG